MSDNLSWALDIPAILQPVWSWLLAYGLLIARPVGLFTVLPLFTRLQITGILRGSVASALILPLIAPLSASIALHPPSQVLFIALVIKETIIGVLLGFLLGIPFWAFSMAGELVDIQRGASQSRIEDPGSREDLSTGGTLFLLVGVAVFVISGGLETVAGAIYQSWSIWRPLSLVALGPGDLATPILGLLDQLFQQSLRLAAPVLIAMLIADVTLMLVSRFVPQMRIDDQATTVRNVVFYVFIALYCVFLVRYMGRDLASLSGIVANVKTLRLLATP